MDQQNSNIEVVLNAVNAAIITIDSSGIILDANPATARLFGHPVEKLLGNDVAMLMPEPHRSAHGSYLDNYLETGVASIIGKGRHVEALHANGQLVPVHLSIGEHYVNGERRFTGILNDLSYQNQISEKNRRLGKLFDETMNEVYVFDANSLNIKDMSTSAVRNLGISREELRSRTFVDINPEYTQEQFTSLVEPLLDGSESRLQFSTTHQRKDNSMYDVNISLTYSNSISGPEFFAIVEDITDKNRMINATNQARKMESVGQLTGGIAHDFNNLLTVISGNLELAQSTGLDEFQMELLKDAKDAADMGARLTNRLLAFASRSSLSPALVDLNDLVVDVSEILRRSLGENITLNLALSPELWSTRVDISQLENALVNLAVNARDAMPSGGKLSITTSSTTVRKLQASELDINAGDYVTLTVSDSGSGIEAEHLSKIFEPFFTTKPGSMGTGLGLSMIYGFTRQSGGGITVDSAPGQGAAFTLYLPRARQMTDTGTGTVAITNSTEPATKLTILIAEDEERVRKLTRLRLEKLGHAVIEASNGYEALELYQQIQGIDLVFSDMIMTEGMTGHDLAQAIRSRNPQAKMLLTSGYADELLDTDKLTTMGIDLLRKPYQLEELETHIAKLFA